MDETRIEKIKGLKRAILGFLGGNDRHYGDLTRLEQSIEDLAQALNTRLDQLLICIEENCPPPQMDPGQALAEQFYHVANKLSSGGAVDKEAADLFSRSLDMFDRMAEFRRRAEAAKDAGETAAILHKRGK